MANWVATQRTNKAKDTLSADRKERLEAIGFVWDPLSAQWEAGFSALEAYKQVKGDCLVPKFYKTDDGFALANWVQNQRANRAKDTLSADRKERLEAIGFVWDPLSAHWEAGFRALEAYKQVKGHCLVPATLKTDGGFALGSWVRTQRKAKIEDKLSADRKERLEAIGFVWSVKK